MGEAQYGDVLEELDKTFPNYVTYSKLQSKGYLQRTFELAEWNLIELKHKSNHRTSENHEEEIIRTGQEYRLNTKGFEFLNQIRIKKSLNNLDSSIKKFDKTASKQANILIILTIAIVILTIILVIKG